METIELCNNLIETYDEYVELLEKEISYLLGYAVSHGYKGDQKSYQNGIRIREKIKELKQMVENEKSQSIDDTIVFLKAWDFSNLKFNLMQMLDTSEIELLSFFRYPSCVRNVIISSSTENDAWLKKFGDRILEEILPKYDAFFDNKIVIEFRPIVKKSEMVSSLFFGYKDNQYSIGLSVENKDGWMPHKLNKKKIINKNEDSKEQ